MYSLLRPLLFKLDAEQAHDLTLSALGVAQRSNLMRLVGRPPPALPVEVFGLGFPNPVGIAAGLDKDGAHLDALGALGFGFIELGTVTPRPQPGNPRPRLFRLPESEAVINRMGFNNAGVDALLRNIAASHYDGILGINIGRNKDTPNERAADDYVFCLERVHARADYVTINISSPNTQGLRDLQHADALRRLVGTLRDAQERLAARAGAKRKPMLLKLAPDLDDADLDAIAKVLLEHKVDGIICTNTTISRPGLTGAHAAETGGLSGRPLFEPATAVLRGMHQRLGGAVPVIGVGGILEGDDAAQKIAAGASLVQLYSGLVFRGPELLAECIEEIARQGLLDAGAP